MYLFVLCCKSERVSLTVVRTYIVKRFSSKNFISLHEMWVRAGASILGEAEIATERERESERAETDKEREVKNKIKNKENFH